MNGLQKFVGTIAMVVGLTIVVTALIVGRSGGGRSDAYYSDRTCVDRSVVTTAIAGRCVWAQARIDQAFFFTGATAIGDPYYSMRVRVVGRAASRVTFARGAARPLFLRVQRGERDASVQLFDGRIALVRDVGGSYETRDMPRTAAGNALHLAMVGGGLFLFGLLLSLGSIWDLFDDRRVMAD